MHDLLAVKSLTTAHHRAFVEHHIPFANHVVPRLYLLHNATTTRSPHCFTRYYSETLLDAVPHVASNACDARAHHSRCAAYTRQHAGRRAHNRGASRVTILTQRHFIHYYASKPHPGAALLHTASHTRQQVTRRRFRPRY